MPRKRIQNQIGMLSLRSANARRTNITLAMNAHVAKKAAANPSPG